MGKNPFIFFSSVVMVTATFWACGDGTVDARGGEDELALLNYGPPFVEGDTGNMWTLRNNAIKDCEADDVCKAAMENADGELDIPEEESSSSEAVLEESSAATESRSSSSRGIVINSAGAPVISTVSSDSQGGSGPVETTSAASATSSGSSTIPSVVLKYCQPVGGATTVVKGTPVQWQFRTNGAAAKSFSWSFTGADITTSEEESPTTVFAETGFYTPTLTIDGESKPITCNKLTVVGPEVTGCTCGAPTYTPSSADLKDNNPVTVEWTITGCSSIDGLGRDAERFDYTWTGATGTSATATASFSELGSYTVSATVKNPDGNSAIVSCPAATIIDNTPFKCNSGNSTAKNFDGNQIEFAVSANQCYAISIKASKGYNATVQGGNWSGNEQKIYFTDCSGEKKTESLKTGGFSGLQTGYQDGSSCTMYMYPAGDFNFVMALW